ncbi:MAG: hypothetical protein J7J46_04820 [Candidatus Desulfofervidus sp.]|nr:hypothetical protein [Candidatus Desulfofervidus sp.]
MRRAGKPFELLKMLAEEAGLPLDKLEDYAFGREENPVRYEWVAAKAKREWKRGTLMLLLLYFFDKVARVKRILGYRDNSPHYDRNFFRELLWQYADRFFLDGNYCIFCDERVDFSAEDPHFGRYLHLVTTHFPQLLVGKHDYKRLSEDKAIEKLQSLRKYFAGER